MSRFVQFVPIWDPFAKEMSQFSGSHSWSWRTPITAHVRCQTHLIQLINSQDHKCVCQIRETSKTCSAGGSPGPGMGTSIPVHSVCPLTIKLGHSFQFFHEHSESQSEVKTSVETVQWNAPALSALKWSLQTSVNEKNCRSMDVNKIC